MGTFHGSATTHRVRGGTLSPDGSRQQPPRYFPSAPGSSPVSGFPGRCCAEDGLDLLRLLPDAKSLSSFGGDTATQCVGGHASSQWKVFELFQRCSSPDRP